MIHFGPRCDTFKSQFYTLWACSCLRSISIVSTPKTWNILMMYFDLITYVLNVCRFRWWIDVAPRRFSNLVGTDVSSTRDENILQWYILKTLHSPQSLCLFLTSMVHKTVQFPVVNALHARFIIKFSYARFEYSLNFSMRGSNFPGKLGQYHGWRRPCIVRTSTALFQIMTWRRPGDKPLSELMVVIHICVDFME